MAPCRSSRCRARSEILKSGVAARDRFERLEDVAAGELLECGAGRVEVPVLILEEGARRMRAAARQEHPRAARCRPADQCRSAPPTRCSQRGRLPRPVGTACASSRPTRLDGAIEIDAGHFRRNVPKSIASTLLRTDATLLTRATSPYSRTTRIRSRRRVTPSSAASRATSRSAATRASLRSRLRSARRVAILFRGKRARRRRRGRAPREA